MYFRVFSLSDGTPDLAAMLEHLHAAGRQVDARFRGDDLGWTGGDLVFEDKSVTVERYLTKEDDLRDDLNTWAGWLETRSDQPRLGELMQHIIGTKQLITLRAEEPAFESLCHDLCRWLAARTRGIYQADGHGFMSAEGVLLLREGPP